MIRLNVPFAVWSRSVDNGSTAAVRQWLRASEKKLEERCQPFVQQLMLCGFTAYRLEGDLLTGPFDPFPDPPAVWPHGK